MRKTFNLLVAICSLAVAFTACQSDDQIESEFTTEPGLYMTLGDETGEEKRETRALATDEGVINSLYAIYFKYTGTGDGDNDDTKYTYINYEEVLTGGSDNLTSATKTYRLNKNKLTTIQSSGTNKDRKVVFVANVEEADLKISLLTGTSNKLRDFKANVQIPGIPDAGKSAWLTSESKFIPMYICSKAVNIPTWPYDKLYYINETSNTTDKTHYLVRMMAKFQIENKKITATATKYNYFIEEVSIVNGSVDGLVCYDENKWATNRVNAPSIPTSPAAKSTKSNANKFTYTPVWSNAATSLKDQTIVLYGFETEQADDVVNNTSNCYLLLKGKRVDDSSTPVVESGVEYMLPVYRIISDSSGGWKGDINYAGDVLRNHKYLYTISGVQRHALNATLTVRPWTSVGIADANPIPLR